MIEEKYQKLLNTPSDVHFHFETIRNNVLPGDRIAELGVRKIVSSWALLANKPRELVSVDIEVPPQENLDEIVEACEKEGIIYSFYKGDSTQIEFDEIDVLFIDTLHLYSQVVKELWRHSENTRRIIMFHDSLIPEVRAAIWDFLYNTHWRIKEENPNGTGLMVLERV